MYKINEYDIFLLVLYENIPFAIVMWIMMRLRTLHKVVTITFRMVNLLFCYYLLLIQLYFDITIQFRICIMISD